MVGRSDACAPASGTASKKSLPTPPGGRREGTGAPPIVKKAALKTTDAVDPPSTTIFTPDTEFGSRFLVEVVRGCANLCRFCWAGYNYLPVRGFPADRILELAEAARPHAGRVGLVSIALCDHPEIDRILGRLLEMGYGARGALIGHTQPRRIAARSVAQRIAAELGQRLGEGVVGYQVRFTRETDHVDDPAHLCIGRTARTLVLSVDREARALQGEADGTTDEAEAHGEHAGNATGAERNLHGTFR